MDTPAIPVTAPDPAPAAGPVPSRVAIIMDGNGRWAKHRGLPTALGHAAGADVLRERVRDAAQLGVEQLTIYAFSTENWSRPGDEVTALMALFAQRLVDELPELLDIGARVRFLGASSGLGRLLRDRMDDIERATAHCDVIELFVAFNYGARSEILHAASRYEGGGDDAFRALLYAPELRDPDVLIRTGGERRISNFLLWQCAHTELIFRGELWPDFDRAAFADCLRRGAVTSRASTP